MVVVSLENVSGGSLNEAKIHDQVYEALSEALIQGKIPPLKPVSLPTLPHNLGGSPMPLGEEGCRVFA